VQPRKPSQKRSHLGKRGGRGISDTKKTKPLGGHVKKEWYRGRKKKKKRFTEHNKRGGKVKRYIKRTAWVNGQTQIDRVWGGKKKTNRRKRRGLAAPWGEPRSGSGHHTTKSK